MSAASTVGPRVLPPGAEERQGSPAGVVSRLTAMALDAVYVLAGLAVCYAAVSAALFLRAPARFRFPSPTYAEALLLGAVLAVAMLAVTWSSTGRSPGMRIMGLRLLAPGGGDPGPLRSLLRALACVVFPLGLAWSAVSRRNASVQDLVFGTSVVYDWHQRVPAARRSQPTRSGRE